MPTPRTGLRQPARDPSRFLCDYYAVALVRSGQPAVWARVRPAVATHRVVTLFSRRYFRLPTFPRVATRRPAPRVGRAVCCWLERHAVDPASPAVSLDTTFFAVLAIDVIHCWSGPGDVAVTADAYVVGEGVGVERKALVLCWYGAST